jgi:hypothetical protein
LARQIPKQEKNYDYDVYRHLYKVPVEDRHKLKINPKYLSYNSIHHHLKEKVGDRTASGTSRSTLRPIYTKIRRRRTIRVYIRQKQLSDGAGRSDNSERQAEFREDGPRDVLRPGICAALKITQEVRVLKGLMKQRYDVRKKYNLDLGVWIVDYRKQHPNTYLPTLQQTFRKWMKKY